MRDVMPRGKEVVNRLEQVDHLPKYRVRRRSDGMLGTAVIAESSFRMLVCGCNVAGLAQDIIFVPDNGVEAWVIKKGEYGTFYETVT